VCSKSTPSKLPALSPWSQWLVEFAGFIGRFPSAFAKAASAAVETTLATVPVRRVDTNNSEDLTIQAPVRFDFDDNRNLRPNVPKSPR
jgi:hypothetical protein